MFIQSEKRPDQPQKAFISGRTLLDIAGRGVQKLCSQIMGLPQQHKAR